MERISGLGWAAVGLGVFSAVAFLTPWSFLLVPITASAGVVVALFARAPKQGNLSRETRVASLIALIVNGIALVLVVVPAIWLVLSVPG